MNYKILGEISKPKQWKNLPISQLKDSGFPVYGANGIIGYYDEFNHEKPTIAITCRGATCGSIHVTQERSYITSNAMALDELDENLVELNYLAKYLRFRGLNDVTTGAAQPQITRANLEKVKIPLPQIDDQKRIAYLLGKVEGAIAQRKQHLQQLDDLLKSVFLKMFGDPIRNPKNQKVSVLDPYITHLTSGGRGWARYYAPSGKRFIRSLDVQMNNIGSDDIVYVNPPNNKESERTRVQPDDVLLTMTGSKIGRVCYVPKDFEEAYVSQHVAIIRTKNINPIYLSFYISMPNCGQYIIKKQQYGQTKPGLNLDQVRNFEIIDPDINLQNDFAAIVEKVEGIKARYQESLTDLENLYGALSQKAFKSELNLSQVPLSSESTGAAEEENHDTSEQQQTTNTLHLPAPSDLATLKSTKGRNAILDQWLAVWHEQLNNEPIPVQLFMEAAQQRLWELADEAAQQRLWELTEDDTLKLGAAEYDYVRAWIFESLGREHLAQTYDDNKNRVQLKAVSNR